MTTKTFKRVGLVTISGGALTLFLSALAGAQSGTAPADPLGGALWMYGPLGIICAALFVWMREREIAHGKERAQAWNAITELKDTLGEKHDRTNETLARIETILKERE